MKRLLAYLFIVLGLGLVFSANGNASRNDCSGETSKNKTVINYYYEFNRLDFLSDQEILSNSYKDFFISDQRVLLGKNKYQQNNKIPKGYKCISGDKYVSRIKEYKKKRKDLKIIINFKEKLITRIVALGGKPKIDTFEINSDNDIIVLRKQLEDLREPSQTQEVAKLQNSDIINTAWILDSRYFVLFLKNEKCKFNDKGLDSIIRNLNYEGSWGISCKYKLYSNNRVELEHDLFNYPVKLYLAFSNNTFVGSIGSGFQGLEKILSGKKQPNVKGVKKELTPLQIAKLPKTEPSQTQEVASKEINTNDQFEMYSILNSSGINRIFSGCTINQWCGRNDPKFIVSMLLLENGKCRFGNKPDGLIKSYNYEGSFDRPCKYKINKYDKNTIHFEIGSGQRIANIKINKITLEASGVPLSYLSSYPKTVTRFKKEEVLNIAKKYEINNLVTKITGSANNQTQIAKTEPTITPKKKVAKTTQEIFKPEDKDIDNDPPRIEIAEAITVVSQSYTIKGIVKDKSKPIYLEINGRPIEVKNNKFELERFNIDPDVVEELKIVAIDQWNNRSEKIVKVTVELQSTEVVRTYEELKPNRVKVKMDKDKIAIIIGIEKYENLINLDAKYANRDAQAFRTYATKALGIKPSNIKVLIDDKANRGNTLEAFKLWLPKIANNDGKDIYVFFAGHGLASENGEDLYILPQDGNAKLLDDTAITRVELISLIQKVNPKSVTMFFDTCYSGQTRDERMLVASLLRPIRIVAEEQDIPDNFTIFSASNFDQASGGIEEAKHGMFSYYLMKGLEGKADNNKDKKITNGELIAYLKTNVSKEAFTQNREQDPMLSGDPDQVLMSYR